MLALPPGLAFSSELVALSSASAGGGAIGRGRREFEHFAQQAGRQRRQRIDVHDRRARLADHFVGDAEQAFLFAAEEQAHDRNLAEQIVGAVERHQRAAQMHLVAAVIDHAVDRAAEHGSAHHAVAQRQPRLAAGEVDLHAGEVDIVGVGAARRLRTGLRLRTRLHLHRLFELGLVVDREIPHVEAAELGRIVRRRRIDHALHLAAIHARIDVVEAEEGAGIAGLQLDHLPRSRAGRADRRSACRCGRSWH